MMAESIIVRRSQHRPVGQDYVLERVFRDFLGQSIQIEEHAHDRVDVVLPNGRTLTSPSLLFSMPESQWLARRSVPRAPLPRIEALPAWAGDTLSPPDQDLLHASGIPVPFATSAEAGITVGEESLEFTFDVFGSIFFWLTLYQEAADPQFDKHQRFPASESLLFGEGALDHPLVDIYTELLWAGMSRLCPKLERPERAFSIVPTHDVDAPTEYPRTALQMGLHCGRLIVKDRQPKKALRRGAKWLGSRWAPQWTGDRYNTFSRLMDESESRGLQSRFYVMAGREHGVDCRVPVTSSLMKRLLSNIGQRGHEIGLHPSYYTMDNPALLKRELRRLRNTASDLGIKQDTWGGRQHYLRWRTPQSFRAWSDAGLDYDSTLGFAAHAGFRCGTSRAYPAYDVGRDRALSLIERPLIAMDATLLSDNYMGFGSDYAAMAEYLSKLKEQCRFYGGTFTLLWHNSRFTPEELWDVYLSAIS